MNKKDISSKEQAKKWKNKLKEGKQRLEDVRNQKEMPEDFKNQLIKIYSTLEKGLEEKINSLKS